MNMMVVRRLTTALLLSVLMGALAATSVDLIEETCERATQSDPNISYRFCKASLEAAPDAKYAYNLRRLGSTALKLTRHNVSHTAHYVRILLKNTSVDPFVESGLEDCFQLYYDAISTLKEVVRDYRLKRYDDANIKLSSVMDASSTCEDGFSDQEGVVSPITRRNNDVFQLSAIALSIINMLRADALELD